MKKNGIFIMLTVLLFASACNWNKDRLRIDLSGIKIRDVKIHRYDLDLFRVPVADLEKGLTAIKDQYRFFLGTDLTDTLKIAEMRSYLQNPRNIDFHKACKEYFTDMTTTEKELTEGLRHFKFYFPDAVIPEVYSYISGGDYENPVRLVDSVMIIALDTYLGKDFKPYLSDGLPLYRTVRMTPDNIVPACMKEMINTVYPGNPEAVTLLDQMVDAGKKLYLLDAMVPDIPAFLKIEYTPAQLEWIRNNESHAWAAIIENRMLYSSDGQVIRIFLADGPYTPEFTRESPPRIGQWIGWRIVKNYMDNNSDVTVQQMISEKDSQKILSLSGYKPGK